MRKTRPGLPIALEMTFIHKDIQKDNGEYVNEFPNKELDFPNNPYKEDLNFSFRLIKNIKMLIAGISECNINN